MIETVHVTSALSIAALRVALESRQVVDVVNDDGETIHGLVLDVHDVDGELLWRVQVEHVRGCY
jgi:hypothetical protein